MQITIVDVAPAVAKTTSNGRMYQELEVTYKAADGKVTAKKLMSFSNPGVFQKASTLLKGNVVDVTTVKNAKTGYWDWTAINEGGETVAQPERSASPSPTRVAGSNYETKEERAARQVMIVRQSSLSTAAAALTVGAKSSPTATDLISYAKQLELYVLGQVDLSEPITNISDDIPE